MDVEVEVARETVWKVSHAADHHVSETIDAATYPFAWRVAVLVRAWDAFTDHGETTWRAAAHTLPTERGGNVRIAPLEGTRRVTVDADSVARVTEIAAAERPGPRAEERSFEEALRVVLDAWNGYYGRQGAGWVNDPGA
jgi:hypothetical protein